MTSPNGPDDHDVEREYRARVPFMAVLGLVGGIVGGLLGVQWVLGLGLGLIAFAIFGVAVVVFAALVCGTVGSILGLFAYEILDKVRKVVRGSARAANPPEPAGRASAERQARLTTELDTLMQDITRRQASGELPPPNPESDVPYAETVAEWQAARRPNDRL